MCTQCLREWIDATRAASDPTYTTSARLLSLNDMAALTERLEHCTHGATPPRPSVLPPSLPSLGDTVLVAIAREAWDSTDDYDGAWIAVVQALRKALKGNP